MIYACDMDSDCQLIHIDRFTLPLPSHAPICPPILPSLLAQFSESSENRAAVAEPIANGVSCRAFGS
ncbi:hypothetical protein [Massilia sp.]|uniref:hypothetical protein n=1 Tax=Massilia sp. TaxID=1882437 RepID=UPI00391DB695